MLSGPVKQAILGHSVLNVKNLRRSECFYREIWAWALSRRNRKTKMVFLSFGKEHHDIALVELPSEKRPALGDPTGGLHHFCV